MAFDKFTGSFLTNTSTGVQAITGVGFTPKLIIFWGGQKADAQGPANSSDMFFGCATSSTQRWVSSQMGHWGFIPSNTFRSFDSTKCIGLATFGSGNLVLADFVTHDADGFTINITDTDATARRIFYIALGGSDITAKAGTFDLNGSTGSQAVTGVGFAPEFLMFCGSLATTSEGVSTIARFTLGAALSASNRFSLTTMDRNGADPSDTYSRLITTKILGRLSSTDGSLLQEADLISMDAGGFTVNVTTTDAATRYGYLALRGCQIALGTFTEGVATGNRSVTGLSFAPQLLMVCSRSKVSSATIDAGASIVIGAGIDSSNRRVASTSSIDAISATRSQKSSSETKLIRHITATGSSGLPTIDAESDLVTLDATGFTYNMTTADATARQNVYIAFAQNPAPAGSINGQMMEIF